MCSGAVWSPCRFRHCWSSDHVTTCAARSILCKGYGPEVVGVISQTYQVNDQQSRPRTVDCSVPHGSVLWLRKFNAYTEDLANLINNHHLDHHLYADDIQLIEYTTVSDIPNAVMKLQNCIESIHEWYRSRRLQFNPAKTELIWFGSKASLNLYTWADIIKPVGVVRDLWVFLGSELNMDQHIKTVVRSCFSHLQRLRSVRRILDREVTIGLVSAFVTTRLDYTVTPFSQDLLRQQWNPLQRVQNAAADLGVDSEKSTWVDLGLRSRVESDSSAAAAGFHERNRF